MPTEVGEGVGLMSKSSNTTSRRIAFLPKPLFSVRDAAAYLGVSASTVRRRIAVGALRAQRWGRSWIMWRADLDWYYAGVTGSRTPD
jgi:excisionase family DNA binding protein